jgi:hypothetical protein
MMFLLTLFMMKVLKLFTAALSTVISPPASMVRGRTLLGSALPAVLELVDHYVCNHCTCSETEMHLKNLSNEARFRMLQINM